MGKKETTEDNKSDKDDKSDKVSLWKRIFAYMIDVALVSMVTSFIVFPFIDNQAIVNVQNKILEIQQQLLSLEVEAETYLVEMMNLFYSLATKSGLVTLTTMLVNVVYFIVFQFKNNGQTIGKKLMKIRVVSTKEKFEMDQMLMRSLIINSILVDMVLFGFMIFSNAEVYYYIALVFQSIQYIIFIVSAVMIIVKGKGVHDLISYTEVIKEK